MQLLGNLSTKQFLSQYWQKKPLLVRKAVDPLAIPITLGALLRVAEDPSVESRHVTYKPRTDRYELDLAPFPEGHFANLPSKNWTVLVQDMDKRDRTVAELLDQFQFLPQWRTDDVMVSYATRGGSVGPHLDNYDVFLVQGRGRREWRINDKKIHSDDFREDCDLRILKTFKPSHTWILEPGDMLYLPPRVAHWGISLDNECMTYSVGYRAPNFLDLHMQYVQEVLSASSLNKLYEDPGLRPRKGTAEVTASELQHLYDKTFTVKPETQDFSRWLIKYLTTPKVEGMFHAQRTRANALYKHPATKILYTALDGKISLSINGEERILKRSDESFCALIAKKRHITKEDVAKFTNNQRALFSQWQMQGYYIDISTPIR